MQEAISALPALNAALNGLSALLLTAGYFFIRRKQVTAHRWCMHSAFGVSALFLISYLTYEFSAGITPFAGHGWSRPVYFAILFSHIVLAIAIVPLALITLYRGLKERFAVHRWIARQEGARIRD